MANNQNVSASASEHSDDQQCCPAHSHGRTHKTQQAAQGRHAAWQPVERTAPTKRPNGERNFGGQGGTCHHCRRSSGNTRGCILTSADCACARRLKKPAYFHEGCLRLYYARQLVSGACPCCAGVCGCTPGGPVRCATSARTTSAMKTASAGNKRPSPAAPCSPAGTSGGTTGETGSAKNASTPPHPSGSASSAHSTGMEVTAGVADTAQGSSSTAAAAVAAAAAALMGLVTHASSPATKHLPPLVAMSADSQRRLPHMLFGLPLPPRQQQQAQCGPAS